VYIMQSLRMPRFSNLNTRSTKLKVICKGKIDHAIFQLNSSSPKVSLNDVREALERTKGMSPHKRLSYFMKRGMHFSRSLKYIKTIEQLEQAFNDAPTLEQNENDNENDVDNNGYNNILVAPTRVDNDELAKFIAEAVREIEEGQTEEEANTDKYNSNTAIPHLKMDNIALDIIKNTISIGILFLCIMYARYVYLESGM